VEPIKIRPPGDILLKVFQSIGANSKLGLSGRPGRPIGALGTSKLYRILGQIVVFLPTDSNVDFYISFDVMMLIDLFTVSSKFIVQKIDHLFSLTSVHNVILKSQLEYAWQANCMHLPHRGEAQVSTCLVLN